MTLTVLYYFEKKSDFWNRELFKVKYSDNKMELPEHIVDIKFIDYGSNFLDGLMKQIKLHFGLNIGPYKLDRWTTDDGMFCLNLKTADYNLLKNKNETISD